MRWDAQEPSPVRWWGKRYTFLFMALQKR